MQIIKTGPLLTFSKQIMRDKTLPLLTSFLMKKMVLKNHTQMKENWDTLAPLPFQKVEPFCISCS